MMRFVQSPVLALHLLGASRQASPPASDSAVDVSWYPSLSTKINNLDSVINGTGIYGFIFDSSTLPEGTPYNTYNWCNMPHVRATEYPTVNSSYELVYVEVVHRHHKRTPYASNTFPVENYAWDCDDQGLFYYGSPLPTAGANHSSSTYWKVHTSSSNPLAPSGFNGSCQFPQITRGGLDDSHQHGHDMSSIYQNLLHFLPTTFDPSLVSYRVTNNQITSQVASMLTSGMYPLLAPTNLALNLQPSSIDSLEPSYTCPFASHASSTYGPGSRHQTWLAHLDATAPLFARLDSISGVDPADPAWHNSYDHYFDTLSARLCHGKPLPCNTRHPDQCVSIEDAERVFRLGMWEYSWLYRDAGPVTLEAAVAGYGIWIAELAANLRVAMGAGGEAALEAVGAGGGGGEGEGKVKYRHNIAHDGSISRLLAILQVEKMVWPGMGAEVVFELYKVTASGDEEDSMSFLRVLWGGQVLRSSSPTLGVMDMVPVERVLAYFDGLVGVGAIKVPGLCNA